MAFFKRFRFLIFLCVLSLSIYGGIRLYFHLTHGFSIENITSTFSYDHRWTTNPLEPLEEKQVSSILSQEFHYLGKGCQSYVFESQDGEYVLKFFKYQRYRTREWLNLFTFIPYVQEFIDSKLAKKMQKLEGVFHSWTVAFNHAKKETGLVYVHLNKTDHLQKNVFIFDKMGNKHSLDIDQYEFLIQKKATMLADYLEQMNNPQGVIVFLETLLSMIRGEYEKGIADNDPALMQNTGVIAGLPVHIDVGQFDFAEKYRDPELYRVEIFQKFYKFRRWLKEKNPQAGEWLDRKLESEFGENFLKIHPNPRYLS